MTISQVDRNGNVVKRYARWIGKTHTFNQERDTETKRLRALAMCGVWNRSPNRWTLSGTAEGGAEPHEPVWIDVGKWSDAPVA